MGALLVEALNTLNDKGLRYKAVTKEGAAVFQFGVAVPDVAKGKVAKEIIEVTPKAETITISLMGKEKEVNGEGFATFVDGVLELKALQEKEAKLIEVLSA